MSVRGTLRRVNRAMSADETAELLELASVMRLGTADAEGWPYVVPLSFVYHEGKLYFHHTAEESHLSSCLETDPRVCIELDETGPAFLGGETACDVGRVYKSVVGFGRVSLVADPRAKERFFDLLAAKYSHPGLSIPRTYPTLETTLVFQIEVEAVTGKKAEGPQTA